MTPAFRLASSIPDMIVRPPKTNCGFICENMDKCGSLGYNSV